MKIGQVAREAGVSVDTVRFYERRGVLPPAGRRPSGYREFAGSAPGRIRAAKALQDLGFTLDEIVDALRAHDEGGATCAGERWRLEAVVTRLDTRIAELQRVRREAARAVEDCEAGRCRLLTIDDRETGRTPAIDDRQAGRTPAVTDRETGRTPAVAD
ncbi:MerR family DNA-binding transcriptional regulator [Nonomuraea phyllanthi]|uniref:MerR family transcriptional regulator n=1 Tax=Nonomuraea phyllanthi TaxID=2219224 RepID=UPI0012933F53|nr:MerR family transcriptional regulator [Nonomuraea phyllanthi]QFY10729.1 MerR family DNA-binding transcriptional regulator [Nonomuraea phyllanthi]